MNTKAKKRLYVAGLVMIMAMLGFFAFIGSGGASKSLQISDLQDKSYEGRKVQVSGAVKSESLQAQGSRALFTIEPEPGSSDQGQLQVEYAGALPATFGDGIVAICTGTYHDGVLQAKQLVTKCPSKYESAQGALTVKNLLENKQSLMGKETKLAGYIVEGSLRSLDQGAPRMRLVSQGFEVEIDYTGALSDEYRDGIAVVLTGSLKEDGRFYAGDIAIDQALGKSLTS